MTVPGYRVDRVVDTVGAGDGFAAGFISAVAEGRRWKLPSCGLMPSGPSRSCTRATTRACQPGRNWAVLWRLCRAWKKRNGREEKEPEKMTDRTENFNMKIGRAGILPVVKIVSAQRAEALAQALMDGGLFAVEITFRTPAAAEAIQRIVRRTPEMYVCAGTVLTVENARRPWNRAQVR